MNKDWKEVKSLDIKYSEYSLAEFIDLVKNAVPEGTKNDDIRLDFDAEESGVPYYDDVIIESTLTISVRRAIC